MTAHRAPAWIDNPSHHLWLAGQTRALLDVYARGCPDRVGGGFWWVDAAGEPLRSQGKQLWINARMVYAFSLGALLGHPGCDPLVEHGLDYLRRGPLRDRTHGGWFWSLGEDAAPADDSKQAYGHAFVLLAATAAQAAGHESQDLVDDVEQILVSRFWEPSQALYVDTWDADFSHLQDYRGQNANMHLVEALLLAAETTGRVEHLDRAMGIASRLIDEIARDNDWLLPEHFDASWHPDLDLGLTGPQDVFRPFGSTVGHWLEWARLLVQLHHAVGGRAPWLSEAARTLFDQAVHRGWDAEIGGFVFSTDWTGRPHDRDRYHWVIAEAIGAAVSLYRLTGDRTYDDWYRAFWNFAAEHLIEPDGSWRHQLSGDNSPADDAWDGKPDLYHALQATLFARLPGSASLVSQLVEPVEHP